MLDRFEIDTFLEDFLRCFASSGSEMAGYVYDNGYRIHATVKEKHSDEEKENFSLNARDWNKANSLGKIVGVWHTHPDESPPSEIDRRQSEALNLPYLVVTASGRILIHDPYPIAGHGFKWNAEDCYTVAMRFYQRKGIYLSNYIRDSGFYDRSDNILLQNFRKEGFRVLNGVPIMPFDALLIPFASRFTNHCVLVAGMNRIVHHMPKRLSIEQPLPSYFLKDAIHIRHETFQ